MATKIVHLTSVHIACDTRIFHKMCRTLARVGLPVVLVAVAGSDAVVDGVQLRAIPRPRSRRERMTATAWHALRATLREGDAIVHIHDPELIPIGFLLRLCGRKVIYDAHEDIAVNFRTKEWIPAPLRRITALLGDAMTRGAGYAFSAIVAATPTIASRFPAHRTTVIHNYPVLDDYAVSGGERSTSTIAYCGTISTDRGILELIDAMDAPAMPAGVSLVLVGPVDSEELHDAMRRSPGWPRVCELGRLDAHDVPKLLSDVAIAVATLHPTQAYLESLPTKLYEYAAAGAPIICSDFPLWRTIVGDDGARFVDPLDPNAIARAVADVLAHPEEAAAMAQRAKAKVLATYSWESESARLLALYASLGARPGGWIPRESECAS